MKESQRENNDVEFYMGMAVKWYWILLITLGLSMLVGIYRVLTSEKYYEAQTVILVQPQKFPTDVERNLVAEDISTLAQRIKGRTNLEKIIEDFALFPGEAQQQLYIEDKLEILKKRISVELTKGGNRSADSFTVSYKGTDPVRVAEITESLASYIIDENLKLRESQILGANVFLEEELRSMRKKLEKTEVMLKNYRERYMGGLPEQLTSNLSLLDSLNERLTQVRNEVGASKDRLALFFQRTNLVNSGVNEGLVKVLDKDQEIERLRQELNFRLKRYTEYHPDVLQIQSMIKQLEAVPQARPNSAEQPRIQVLSPGERQRGALLAEISFNEKERDTLQTQIALYKKRVEDTPKREQELISLQRDYDNIRSAYHSLLSRQLESQSAVNMEKKQIGEPFRIIDPARVPEKAMIPGLEKWVLFILAAGLGIGCGIVALLEFLMQTFRGAGSVELYTSVPVIANIPTTQGTDGIKQFFVTIFFPVAGGLAMVCLLGAFLSIAYFKG